MKSDNLNLLTFWIGKSDLQVLAVISFMIDVDRIRSSRQLNLSNTIDCNSQLAFELKDVVFCVGLIKAGDVGFEFRVNFQSGRLTFQVTGIMLLGCDLVSTGLLCTYLIKVG